ncbi:MAG: hypothetical protein HYX61_09720 [Gammaproteobacteria bacterium]|jgi:hypothetical protein|nr:hypothetical protein [Gammaproteobacteria bacterium]
MATAQASIHSMFEKWPHLPQFSSLPVAEYNNILTHMMTDLSRANTQTMHDFMKSHSDHMQELTNKPSKAMNILSDWCCENTEQFHQHTMSILDTLFKSAIDYQRLISSQIKQSEHEVESELESESEFESKSHRKK